MLNFTKRGKVYWACGWVRGERIQRSLDTKSREEARLRFQELERQVYTGEQHLLLAWSDVRAEFERHAAQSVRPSTLVKIKFVLARFSRFLNAQHIKNLSSISTPILSSYCQERRGDLHPTRRRALSAEGVKADLRILHRVFAYCVEQKYLKSNPVTQRRNAEPGRITQPFTDDELARMLAACPPEREARRRACPAPCHPDPSADGEGSRQLPGRKPSPQLRAILLTFIHTGLRISDVIGLERREVDLAANLILRRTQKRGKLISIPMHPELRAALEAHLKLGNSRIHETVKSSDSVHRAAGAPRRAGNQHAGAPSSLVFHTASGRPIKCLDDYLGRLWRRAGIPNAHPHRFRDTFAVRLLRQGASLYTVAMLIGTTVATAEKHYSPYVRELQEHSRELVESVPAASTLQLHSTH